MTWDAGSEVAHNERMKLRRQAALDDFKNNELERQRDMVYDHGVGQRRAKSEAPQTASVEVGDCRQPWPESVAQMSRSGCG